MLWIPYKTNMPTWLPLSSSKGSSSWLSWIVFYQGIPLFRRTCKTPRCTKTHFKGSRLGPRSYYTKTYFVVLLLTIPKLSLHFLQVFWLGSKIKFTERTIWSLHPVETKLTNNFRIRGEFAGGNFPVREKCPRIIWHGKFAQKTTLPPKKKFASGKIDP